MLHLTKVILLEKCLVKLQCPCALRRDSHKSSLVKQTFLSHLFILINNEEDNSAQKKT